MKDTTNPPPAPRAAKRQPHLSRFANSNAALRRVQQTTRILRNFQKGH